MDRVDASDLIAGFLALVDAHYVIAERTAAIRERIEQALGRATLVGQNTRGAAHAKEQFQVDAHYFISIPTQRPVNPKTKTNWEGRGVAPDVEAASEASFALAYRMALRALSRKDDSPLAETEEIEQALRELPEGSEPTMHATSGLFAQLDNRRIRLSMSKADLARRAGVSLPTVQRLLSGREGRPRLDIVLAIAIALGVEVRLSKSPAVVETSEVAAFRETQARRNGDAAFPAQTPRYARSSPHSSTDTLRTPHTTTRPPRSPSDSYLRRDRLVDECPRRSRLSASIRASSRLRQ